MSFLTNAISADSEILGAGHLDMVSNATLDFLEPINPRSCQIYLGVTLLQGKVQGQGLATISHLKPAIPWVGPSDDPGLPML
jgi:hypothetical protein